MFQLGERVIYGTTGVCEIQNIGTVNIPGISKDRMYYTLLPIGKGEEKIYTPVDNQKVVMRRILTKEETQALIDGIVDVDTIAASDDRELEAFYKNALIKCDCTEWVRIIKTIYLHKKIRSKAGKKVTALDERYLKIAKDNLYTELALVLEKDTQEMEAYITKRISK
ncbi:MAG: CarD family transcriptional regulator [Clostridiaceae bacterium]|nr:CarD family transcriptional regulator [Clostridiaceae bacterium]